MGTTDRPDETGGMDGADDVMPDAAGSLAELLAGNQRFVLDDAAHPNQDVHRRATLTGGQRPFALIFGCADSRVAAEIIFDQGLGDLFVVRTAGHAVDNAVLGSIEFGVDLLGIPLVIVLGHDGCGAVKATMEAHDSGNMPSGYLRTVVEMLSSSVINARRAGHGDVNAIVAEHSVQVARELPERSSVIGRRVADGRLAIVAMEYALSDGAVQVLSSTIADPAPI
ncbi:carbonic anhydrase [Kineosporia sp. NBRC 101731]|uniref:carbonic anhydrase n=1 Tax=Kineosporia sp. NBRC 101731 TaxID=3032199 RepID=UPI0024A43772|nr:carbonic anhydrase [Kineosporia sp. NBRC 101731]GLY28604.1 carbonic anhydrase [Kineosporia sp. NBRC 101731]